MRASDNKFAIIASCEGPNFSVVPVEPLYLLKLKKKEVCQVVVPLKLKLATYLVSIPVLEHLIFAHRPKVMSVSLEGNLHDAIVVGKQRPVAVSKVETPYFDVLVGGAGNNQL